MRLEELLKVVSVKNTDSGLEVRIDFQEENDFDIFDDYSYIMSIGFTVFKDAKVTDVTAIDDTLIIYAEM